MTLKMNDGTFSDKSVSPFHLFCGIMIPGSKGHVLHAYMKKHDFGTRILFFGGE
jgi:hypothetical protein